VESKQEIENVSEMVCSNPTDSRETQNSCSDSATVEHVGTENRELARVLADHTPRVAATQ